MAGAQHSHGTATEGQGDEGVSGHISRENGINRSRVR
jgi:hypothetical protein